jgi:hypothetical protein
MARQEELRMLQEQIDELGVKIADCAQDIGRHKEQLCILREVQRLTKRQKELVELGRKIPGPTLP